MPRKAIDLTFGIRRIHFYRSLADSAKAGVNTLRALELTASRGAFLSAGTIEGLKRQVQGGFTFSRAMQAYPDDFPAWQVAIVGVGETTGRMDAAFAFIAEALEEQRSFILSVIPGMLYPLLMLHAAPFLLYGAIAYNEGAAPYFLAIFKFLLWFYIPAGALFYLGRRNFGRLRSVPPFSALSRIRFNHFLSSMLKAGVPFLKALEAASFAADVPAKGPPPPEGASVVDHLRNYKVFSPEDLSHIANAEQAGMLGNALDRLAGESRQAWQAAVKSIVSLLPPLFYLIIALGLGYRIFVSLRAYTTAPAGF